MPKLVATHEVNDVAHWLKSPKREEVFANVAKNIQTYVREDKPNSVALSMEIADMAAFEKIMQSQAGADAMKFDGVRPETLVIYIEK